MCCAKRAVEEFLLAALREDVELFYRVLLVLVEAFEGYEHRDGGKPMDATRKRYDVWPIEVVVESDKLLPD